MILSPDGMTKELEATGHTPGVETATPAQIPRDDPRNWTEDYPHENGNYMSTCGRCKRTFFGHKPRVWCRECSHR